MKIPEKIGEIFHIVHINAHSDIQIKWCC